MRIGSAANSARRRRLDLGFRMLCNGAAGIGVLLLGVLLCRIFMDGSGSVSWHFLVSGLSSRPSRTGIWPAISGSLWLMLLTALIACPVGIAAAIYLEEFNLRKTWFTRFVQLNIANLAGVPSIVYGLLGLALFVRACGLGYTLIAGALTMSLLILPMIIVVTQEALRAVPSILREASMGLGSTQWQAIRYQVLPSALPGILTGVILAVGRALGETAPLIVVGAVAGVVGSPKRLGDEYTVLPMRIYTWSMDARAEAHQVAAAGIVVLMVVLLCLNSVAIYLRNRSATR
jgi:phosphate transport system permease protein